MHLEASKKAAGEKAAEFVRDGMIVGLGTGSTAFFFIQKLIELCQKGLKIQAVATSKASFELARKGNIPLADINTLKTIDLCVDGADEVDPQKQLIKGAGGALLREKIIATMSRELVIIIDETKLVPKLGNKPLPIEIVPFGYLSTIHQLELLGYKGTMRRNTDHSLYTTDNNNLLYDIQPGSSYNQQQLLSIPGVIDTGLFLNMTGRVVIGFQDGQVVVQ
jgi:ribose 5-phosphate isomerase A